VAGTSAVPTDINAATSSATTPSVSQPLAASTGQLLFQTLTT